MRHKYIPTILLSVTSLFGAWASAQAQCNSTSTPTAVDYSVPIGTVCQTGNYYDFNTVANDYSTLYFDAKNPSCAAAARTRFEDKLRNNLNYANAGRKICDPRRDTANALPMTDPFQPALAGGIITPIFATAVALLDAGYTVDDTLLQGVRNHFQGIPSPQDPRCGVNSILPAPMNPNGGTNGGLANSCMDDYTGTAAGYGWIAAYEAKKSRSVTTWVSSAKAEINKALSPWPQYGSVCYYLKGSLPARCDATRTQVEQNLANVIGADHNQENPAYGFGLMTSVATACEGLRRASSPCTFTSEQVWIAQQLLLHAQQRAEYSTSEHNYRFINYCRLFQDGSNIGCWDPLFGPPNLPGYLPTLFPLKRFYDAMGLTPSPLSAVVNNSWGLHPAFQFHEYREPRFTWSRDNFWGPNRKLFYEELAYLAWAPHSQQADIYWIQPAALAGFGAPGTLTVAGGSTQSGGSYPIQMEWRNLSTGSAWFTVPYQATPDPNGNPKDVWYNSVPAPTNVYDHYEIRVKHSSGPTYNCIYNGGNTISWCTNGVTPSTPAWP